MTIINAFTVYRCICGCMERFSSCLSASCSVFLTGSLFSLSGFCQEHCVPTSHSVSCVCGEFSGFRVTVSPALSERLNSSSGIRDRNKPGSKSDRNTPDILKITPEQKRCFCYNLTLAFKALGSVSCFKDKTSPLSLFCSPRLHLIDQKYTKNVKYYYNLK